MQTKTRVIANSTVMYLKMILSLGVTFYSTRIILKALGVTDFGIFNLVAGAISLLGFFNGAISNTVQRYLAFEMGGGKADRLRNTFSISLSLNIAIGIILLIVLQLFGLWGFSSFFVIPEAKIYEAKIAYQIMIATTVVSVIATPYNAAINAHEDLILLSIIEFTEACLKLGGAFVLLAIGADRLVWYCIFLLIIQVLSLSVKLIYSEVRYSETRHIRLFNVDKTLLKEMLPFIGWNAIEASSWLGKNQGIAVLMNTCYGTIVNAAYGVASQINGPVTFFSSTLLNAIRPQIYKSGGSGNYERMIRLSILASKFAFLVLFCVFLPFVFLLPTILKIWLTTIPEYSEGFSALLLSITLISYLSIGINIAIQAYGDVKKYQLVTSIIILLSLPIGYGIYSVSDNVYMFLMIMVVVEVITVLCKYYMASSVLPVTFGRLLKEIGLPCVFVCLIVGVSSYLISTVIPLNTNLINAALFGFADLMLAVAISYLVGFNRYEKSLVRDMIKTILSYIPLCKRLVNNSH